jgi:caffeoyl-CoA O-methyltransferase
VRDEFTTLTPELYAYVIGHSPALDDVQRSLIEETAALGPISMMQVAVEQGAFLTLLTRLLGVRRAIEIGTFTGYSALSIARGLADDGRLLCCDTSEEWTAIARRHWERAGVAGHIELRLGPALGTLQALPREPIHELAFIDADKTSYRAYYEELLPRLRPNGLIVFDNVLWGGSVVDAKATDESTRAIRDLNDYVSRDARVDAVMIAVADGLLLARKR